MKKRELIILGILFLVCVVSLISIKFLNTKSGNYVEILSDGEMQFIFPIGVNEECVIECEDGYNKIIIKDGKVSVEEADCNAKICVNKGEISKVNESIICLPHKLVVRIIEKED